MDEKTLSILSEDMFSGMYHEMKTPLCVILGAVKLMEKKLHNNCKLEPKTEIIKLNCYRLLRIISNSIELLGIENNSSILNLTRCNVSKLTKEIIDIVLPYAEENNCLLVFESLNDSIFADIDIDKFEKIILNLISNAIKHSKSSTVYITVSNDKNNLLLSVKDTGTGIPHDVQKSIFEKHSRDCSIHLSSGHGLGLWLVKSLVDIHKGDISLISECDKGTEFTVRIPLIQKNYPNKIKEQSQEYLKERVIDSVKIELSDIYKCL